MNTAKTIDYYLERVARSKKLKVKVLDRKKMTEHCIGEKLSRPPVGHVQIAVQLPGWLLAPSKKV